MSAEISGCLKYNTRAGKSQGLTSKGYKSVRQPEESAVELWESTRLIDGVGHTLEELCTRTGPPVAL